MNLNEIEKQLTAESEAAEKKLEMFRELSKRFSLIRLTGKVPIEKAWELYCKTKRSFDEIAFIPNDNAGVACGPASGVIVLDIDDCEAFKKVCKEKTWAIPVTYTVQTGSGKPHFYFQYPDSGKTYGNRAFKKLGFDIRGDGGQVVALGSIHPDTGQPYKIYKDEEIAPAPQWLLDLYEEPVQDMVPNTETKETQHWDGNLETLPVSAKIRHLIKEGKPKGERSEAIMTVLDALVAKGFSDDQICQIFQQYPIGEKARQKNNQFKWLRGEIATARRYVAANPISKFQDGKPEINAERRDVENVSKQVWDTLSAGNNPPWLFRNPVGVVSLEQNEGGASSFKPVSAARMGHILARKISWYKVEKESKIPALPPSWVIKDMLTDPKPPLPYLLKIVKHPIFSQDGSLTITRGYSTKTKCYYAAPSDLVIPEVSDAPNQTDIQNARTIVEDLLHDFPLAGLSEKATCFALFISPFVRDLIQGQTPLHLIESPCPGTGKSLLARVLTYPALGHDIEFGTVPQSEEEVRKRITSALISNPSFVLFDNVSKLTSSQLSAAITSPIWEDRILGGPEMARLPVKCIWIATGNNPILSTEIARRTIRIRIDAKVDRPWQRDPSQFRHSNIISWVKQNRGELIWAALTLTKAWIIAGCPDPKGLKPLGSFEDYSRVIGGILQVAGVKGFLGNADEFYESSDLEGANLRHLVCKWSESFKDRPVGVSDIYKLVIENDIQLDLGNGKGERGQKTSLGRILSSLRDRVIGEYKVIFVGSKNRANLWRLVGKKITLILNEYDGSGDGDVGGDITFNLNEHDDRNGDGDVGGDITFNLNEHDDRNGDGDIVGDITLNLNELNELRDEVHTDVHSSKSLEEGDKMNFNELNELIGGIGQNNQDDSLNISDTIQYSCDISNTNTNVILKDVHKVHTSSFTFIDQSLSTNELHEPKFISSLDVHCESSSQPDEILSQSSTQNAYDQILADLSENNLTPFICRSGCKHYDGATDANDRIFKEFCCYGRSYRIEGSRPCDHFEDKNPVCYDEDGILRL